jgi:hypothetical protein
MSKALWIVPFVLGNKSKAFGLVGLVDEWVHRDFKETPEEMADIFIHDILQPLK